MEFCDFFAEILPWWFEKTNTKENNNIVNKAYEEMQKKLLFLCCFQLIKIFTYFLRYLFPQQFWEWHFCSLAGAWSFADFASYLFVYVSLALLNYVWSHHGLMTLKLGKFMISLIRYAKSVQNVYNLFHFFFLFIIELAVFGWSMVVFILESIWCWWGTCSSWWIFGNTFLSCK